MRKKIKWLDEFIKELIAEKTGFEASKINLILSKRTLDHSPVINYHKFEYDGRICILTDGKLTGH